MRTTRVRMGGGLLGLVLLTTGCGAGSDEPVLITETRPATEAPVPIPEGVTSAQRFGLNTLPPNHPPMGGGQSAMPGAAAPAGESARGSLRWEAPEGWVVAGERPMRVVTLNAGAVECYVAELAGSAGGARANFSRWAGQLGQAPLTDEAFAALPMIQMLDAEAPLLEVSGTYVGMGETSQPGSRLLGTLASVGNRTFFVKLVGPAAEVEAQREAFISFCASLRLDTP